MLIQPRDISLLRGLFESRILTLKNISDLYFDGRSEAAKKRVQKLKANRLVGERPRRPYEPSILFLTKRAYFLLRIGGHLAGFPDLPWAAFRKRARVSPLTVAHELDVQAVKAAFATAMRNSPDYELTEFRTWPKLYEFRARPFEASKRGHRPTVSVRPDGFIRIRHRKVGGVLNDHIFFLEVDRSSESQVTLVRRASCYVDFYRTGGLARRFGQPATAYKKFPFRVLMIFKTAQRRDNAAIRLLASNPSIRTQIWFATTEEVTKRPLGEIWRQPIDYRSGQNGTHVAQQAIGLLRLAPRGSYV